MDEQARFWLKVDRRPNPTGCLLWIGARKEGYGVFWVGEPGRPTRRAHHVAWEFEHGAVPDGMVLMHACDVRRCVNVTHLRVGTQQQNLQDMKQKGRGGDTQRRLTPAQKAAIEAGVRAGKKDGELADEFGVTRPAVLRIRRRMLPAK